MNSTPDCAASTDAPLLSVADSLNDPLYYLVNFDNVVTWVSERYADLLDEEERDFIMRFQSLPVPSKALLVRMVMRKGEHFRLDRLVYDEIGEAQTALAALIEQGLVDTSPCLTLEQLFDLFTREELVGMFRDHLSRPRDRKALLKDALTPVFDQALTFDDWHSVAGQPMASEVVRLTTMMVCERLRLMFFGNLRQQFSEFVLADQGIYRFEVVPFTSDSRAFQSRTDIERYWQIHDCLERFEAGHDIDAVLAALPPRLHDSVWLEARRGRVLYAMARHCERQGALKRAVELYAQSHHGEARIRRIRVLERLGEHESALALCRDAQNVPTSEAERQQAARIQPRLHRALGMAKPSVEAPAPVQRCDLTLPRSTSVERAVREHLHSLDAPVFYVENTLINALFGLLCWEAIFAPLPGAFFHPFQSGPADLMRPEFYPQRESYFTHCLARLEAGTWQENIRQRYQEKQGIQSPFVHWGALDEALLALALECLPPAHLRLWFERLVTDIRANRAGMPDLIRFYPNAPEGSARYEMIEVKGPGDRLQDNQKRWIAFCARHDMPVTVCHVRWCPDEDLS
ncbi:VRR-NUC domain-containing protein [Kushneria marisflavi]|uniref:phosphodiesterase I n=1 Tax=Kushneria marisflavi TaxID=157779 RepID=A0A240US23_9GAMM|nr:VRR-NUC domain-containing protein [Kushneria marisflavi]ART64307.1 nuclease [Kushneria marisflavi]RKD76774.1 VRR-NUC domain-containing protein [Kushneria marisflavi]